jgi:hypothetical protein
MCTTRRANFIVVGLIIVIFLFIEGPRSRCYGRTAALKAYCATLWGKWWGLFGFSFLMVHRWNDIDRGKPKYSEKNLSQCHFVHHKPHMDRPGIEPWPPRRLTARAVSRPIIVIIVMNTNYESRRCVIWSLMFSAVPCSQIASECAEHRLRVVTLYILLDGYESFGATCCLYDQGWQFNAGTCHITLRYVSENTSRVIAVKISYFTLCSSRKTAWETKV